MWRFPCLLFVLFILLLCPIQGIAFEGFEIVGVGTNPAKALRDGVRQIGEVFGGVQVFSESEVQDFVLKADRIRTSHRNSPAPSSTDSTEASSIEMGYGMRSSAFPGDFVRAVQQRARDTGSAKFSIDWEAITYQSKHADSFGEIRQTSYKLRLPDGYKNLVRRCITSNETFGPISALLIIPAILYLIWLIIRIFWFEEKVRYLTRH